MKLEIKSTFLPKNSCILPGSKIFELINFGTKFTDLDLISQSEKIYSLIDNFDSDIKPVFEDALADIEQETQSDGMKT